MSWAAIVSGKARHTSPNGPNPLVATSSTTTVTINPHIPNISHSTSPPPQLHPSDPDNLSTASHSSSSTHSHDPNYNSPSLETHSSSSSTSSTLSSAQSQQHQQHQQHQHRNHPQTKQKSNKKQQQYEQPQPQPQPQTQPQSPQNQYQPRNMSNQSMWNDPRIVASYRLWTHHISSFMAQPVPFFHVFIVNPQFRQSVFDAGLTFHPDTDPTNPVLINLNSSRFGMAERISALSPPARADARSASKPNTAANATFTSSIPMATTTPVSTSTHMSPLSENSHPSQQQIRKLSSPAAFHGPDFANLPDPIKSTDKSTAVTNLIPAKETVLHCEAQANLLQPFDPYDPQILQEHQSAAVDESFAQRFVEATRLDISDSESERLSEGDPVSVNGGKTQTSASSKPVPVAVRRRNGRSRVVSRVLDIRIPTSPVCTQQTDKAKVEFIEQIGEIFPRITPPKDYGDVRADLLARLRKVISEEWKGAGIDVYGSAGNGLGLRSADVDMSLLVPDEVAAANSREGAMLDSPREILARLAAMMEENKMAILSKFLSARVPVIKMLDPVSELQVDVCVNNILAVRNTELLKAYVDLDERFRYVCILVKLWAKRRDLNDTYHGTLSSYAYTLLVIHYMQVTQPPVLPCLQRMVNGKLVSSDEKLPTEMTDNGHQKLFNTYFDRTVTPETFTSANTQPVHELLMGFFKYYAYTFKYRTDLASIRLGVKTPRSARKWDESAVYAEWEAKQAQYKAQLEAARAALDARRKGDVEERKVGTKEGETSEETENNVKRERIQFPRRPRLASKHLFCIEDPFDIDHDLSRGMEKAAVTVIRQEMMRAYELIAETGDYELVCEEYRY